jgi:cytoplasmic iron level regulating protein YaaA (DUF328/UPF0246 family)
MSNYIILLPPSEGKEAGGELEFNKVNSDLSFDKINNSREYLLEEIKKNLNKISDKFIEKVFDVKIELALNKKNQLLNLKSEKTMPCIKRYSGVMFKAIDYDSLNEVSKNHFNNNVIFISGLFGKLKPLDLIPDYKLKINAKVLDLNVEKFWRENLKESFIDTFKDKIVIDILPEAHRKVVDYSNSKSHYQVIFGEFKEVNGENKFKQAGHNSKVLKGELVRYLVNFDNLDLEILKNFEHSLGYTYNEELSNENAIIYLKK